MSALPPTDQFHLGRSLCIDGFAEIEQAIVRLLQTVGMHAGADMVGQKIERLRGAKPSPQYSKTRRTKVNGLLDEIERLLPVRNDLVHSRMRLGRIDNQTFAVLVNPRGSDDCGDVARLMTNENLSQLQYRLERILLALRD